METVEHIEARKRAYWKDQRLTRDGNITRETKLRIYTVATKPVIMYAVETVCFTINDGDKLRRFERGTIRRISVFSSRKILSQEHGL